MPFISNLFPSSTMVRLPGFDFSKHWLNVTQSTYPWILKKKIPMTSYFLNNFSPYIMINRTEEWRMLIVHSILHINLCTDFIFLLFFLMEEKFTQKKIKHLITALFYLSIPIPSSTCMDFQTYIYKIWTCFPKWIVCRAQYTEERKSGADLLKSRMRN